MNDKIRKFSIQLSEAAPPAPDLEGRSIPESRSPVTALRVGVAIVAVAVLGAVGLVVTRDNGRTAVVPAGDQTAVASSGAIADAVSAALPAGFTLQLVERVDRYTAHAVAVNDRFDVLDIEIIAAGPPVAITDDTAVTMPVCAPPTTGAYTNTDPCATFPVGDTPTTVAYYVCDTPPASTIGIEESATGSMVYSPTTEKPDVPDCTVVVDPNMPPVSVPFTSEPEGVLVGTGEITMTTGVDPFGPDEANIPSPFTASSASTDRVFVGIAMYSINAVAAEGVAPAILGNLGEIANLEAAILSLPEALAPVDFFTTFATPNGVFTTRGMRIGSLTVSLSARNNDGTTLVQVGFPGTLEGSGNDGSIYWHAVTIDGRVFIALLNPGDGGSIDGADPAELVHKVAAAGTVAGSTVISEYGFTDVSFPDASVTPGTSTP